MTGQLFSILSAAAGADMMVGSPKRIGSNGLRLSFRP
jgi:hypothetical protein